MECSLVMFKSDGTRKDIPLVGERSVIGRMSSCEVRIPLNSVSREHCALICDGQTLRYEDLNSSNGVVLNGAKSKKGTLRAGDELLIGPVIFTVMIDGKPNKITPIRTILDEDTDLTASKAPMGKGKDDSRGMGTTVGGAALPVAGSKMLAFDAIDPSPEDIQPVGSESDVEEFGAPAASAAKPAGKSSSAAFGAMPEPIGDEEDAMETLTAPLEPVALPKKSEPAKAKDDLAPMADGSGSFEFVDDAEGDEEEPAFTFE